MAENSGEKGGGGTKSNQEDHPKFYHLVYGLGFSVLFSFADFAFLWPESHLGSLAFLAAALSLLAAYEMRIFLISSRWIVAVVIFIVCGAGVTYALIGPNPPQETDSHGWLIPANDPTPTSDCLPHGNIEGNYVFVFLGDGVAMANAEQKFTVLKIGDRDAIKVKESSSGLMIDADMWDELGNLAARIEDNEYHVIPGQTSYRTRPDRSTLIVYDKSGDELLWVRYLNPKAVRIRGVFHKIGNATPIRFTDDAMYFGSQHMPLTCVITMVPVQGTAITLN